MLDYSIFGSEGAEEIDFGTDSILIGFKYELDDPSEYEDYSVFYYPADGEMAERMEIKEYKDGYFYVWTTHFSQFGLVEGNTWEVVFNENGHGTAPESQFVEYGRLVDEPDEPE